MFFLLPFLAPAVFQGKQAILEKAFGSAARYTFSLRVFLKEKKPDDRTAQEAFSPVCRPHPAGLATNKPPCA